MNKGYQKVAFLFRSTVKKTTIFDRTLFIFFVLLEDGLDHTLLQGVGNLNAYKFEWWTNCYALKALEQPANLNSLPACEWQKSDAVYAD